MSTETFRFARAGRARVWLRADLEEALHAAGLADPANWERHLAAAPAGPSGRGAVARIALPGDGPRIVVKRLERGGALAALWRGRFAGIGRVVANLVLPERALRGAVATPRAVALVAIPGPPGFWRGRLAVEEITGAEDLRRRLPRGPLRPEEARAVARVLRAMHGVGLDHRDLNLGNLLLREGESGPEAFVLDLDGARWLGRSLPFAARQRSLRRLERSCRKILGPVAGAAAAEAFYSSYAAEVPELAGPLASGRARGRAWLALRSLGRDRFDREDA